MANGTAAVLTYVTSRVPTLEELALEILGPAKVPHRSAGGPGSREKPRPSVRPSIHLAPWMAGLNQSTHGARPHRGHLAQATEKAEREQGRPGDIKVWWTCCRQTLSLCKTHGSVFLAGPQQVDFGGTKPELRGQWTDWGEESKCRCLVLSANMWSMAHRPMVS